MSSAHTKSNRVSHSRSSSVSSHRVPVPPLIPLHSLPGIDAFSPSISPASSLPQHNHSSNHQNISSNQPNLTSILDISSSYPDLDATRSERPSNVPDSSSPALGTLDKPSHPPTTQRIHFALPCPPAPAYHKNISSVRTISSTLSNHRSGQHYRVHSAANQGNQSEKPAFKGHCSRPTSKNQHATLPFLRTYNQHTPVRSFWGLIKAFGTWIATWFSALALTIRSWWQALRQKFTKSRFHSRHGTSASFPSDKRCSMPSDTIEETYVPVDFPPNLAVRIATVECGEVEIEFGMLESERGVEVPYQVSVHTCPLVSAHDSSASNTNLAFPDLSQDWSFRR